MPFQTLMAVLPGSAHISTNTQCSHFAKCLIAVTSHFLRPAKVVWQKDGLNSRIPNIEPINHDKSFKQTKDQIQKLEKTTLESLKT